MCYVNQRISVIIVNGPCANFKIRTGREIGNEILLTAVPVSPPAPSSESPRKLNTEDNFAHSQRSNKVEIRK